MSKRKNEMRRDQTALVPPEGTGGERSESPGPGGGTKAAARPDSEVEEKSRRRTFTADYKRRILRRADSCTKPGEVGALLRREGLYSSHLTNWRQQRERGELAGLSPRKRGRKSDTKTISSKAHDELRRENQRLRERLEQAELIIDIQKKVSKMLGIPLKSPEDDGSG